MAHIYRPRDHLFKMTWPVAFTLAGEHGKQKNAETLLFSIHIHQQLVEAG